MVVGALCSLRGTLKWGVLPKVLPTGPVASNSCRTHCSTLHCRRIVRLQPWHDGSIAISRLTRSNGQTLLGSRLCFDSEVPSILPRGSGPAKRIARDCAVCASDQHANDLRRVKDANSLEVALRQSLRRRLARSACPGDAARSIAADEVSGLGGQSACSPTKPELPTVW